MKKPLTDQEIGKALHALKRERPADAAWDRRAWSAIEARLAEPRPAFRLFGPSALRWAAAAACLILAVGLGVQHRRAQERDLGAYVINLYSQSAVLEEEGEVDEPLLLTDGAGILPVGYNGDDESAPTVIDTLLEL